MCLSGFHSVTNILWSRKCQTINSKMISSIQVEVDSSAVDEIRIFTTDPPNKNAFSEKSGFLKQFDTTFWTCKGTKLKNFLLKLFETLKTAIIN